jgi:hypothetical protein
MKKKVMLGILIVFLCSCFLLMANGKITGDEPVKAGEPLLITNAGQGPGGKMARLLVIRSEAVEDWTYNAEPEPEDLEEKPYKTMLVVIGSSAKGLGASGITIDDEIDRLNRMIKKAKELGIQIVAAQIEGKARRDREGGPNERSIDAIAPYADYIIIKDDADFDGKFTKISQENNIPMTVIEDTVEFTEVIKAMYSKAD